MALRRHEPAYRQLDQLVMEGRAQLVATSVSTLASATILIAPTDGQVAIITKIVCTNYGDRQSSPDTSFAANLSLFDSTGTGTEDNLTFIAFQRTDAVFASPSGPDHRSAQPIRPVVWEPESPLLVPSKFSLRASSGSTMAGGNFMLYGYVTDVDTARHLGFSANPQGYGATPGSSLNLEGFRGGEVAIDDVPRILGQAGYCIQILDLNIRHQQLTAGATTAILFHNLATAAGGGGIGGFATAANVILTTGSKNPGDPVELQFSPQIYLPPGTSLYWASADGARASFSCTFRMVRTEDVPTDHWWSNTTLPAPGTVTLGTTSQFTTASNGITVKYPKRTGLPTGATATIPGVGKQHVVEGYAISIQKDATTLSDQLFFAITTGVGGGPVGVDGSGLGTVNKLISPILAANSHDQTLALAVDGINVPCVADTGFVLIDTTATGASATPAAADLDVASSSFLVWGRTVPTRFGTGHFQGA